MPIVLAEVYQCDVCGYFWSPKLKTVYDEPVEENKHGLIYRIKKNISPPEICTNCKSERPFWHDGRATIQTNKKGERIYEKKAMRIGRRIK